MTTTEIDINQDALERAMEMARNESPSRRQQLDSMLKDGQPWKEVAWLAVTCCQTKTLHLKPWQSPPCWNDDRDKESQKLLKRMLAAGLSQYEPDPLAALEPRSKGRK
jgi:hypothetical protein